jgi:hypothetical protein
MILYHFDKGIAFKTVVGVFKGSKKENCESH